MSSIFNGNEQNIPFDDMLREFFARRPSDVDGVANTSAMYYRKKLLRLILARFEWELPREWDKDYFLTTLFHEGHIAITDTPLGVLALRSGLTGINVYDRPTTAVFANHVLGNFNKTIGVDCSIIKLMYDYTGVDWIITRYATLLAMCDSGIAVNLMNTKATYVFGATSKGQAQTFKKMYDDIAQGKPAVFVGDGVTKESFFNMPAKENFIADDVQLLKRKIVNEFLTDIGINNTNLDKRERLTDDEVNANNEEVRFNIMDWYDNIQTGIKETKILFPEVDMSCQIRNYNRNLEEVTIDDITERS